MAAHPPAAPRRAPGWAKPLSVTHIALYRATGGVIGYWLGSQRALLLTTPGRRSGQPRTQPLTYYPLEGKLALVASNFGSDTPPAWYLNLVARPEAWVQLRRETFPVTATVATAEERARLWPLIVARLALYAHYQAGTAREIPVVLLRRAG
jgi:deazaflavin-dependent oxidoreductase (nitroreductase family)